MRQRGSPASTSSFDRPFGGSTVVAPQNRKQRTCQKSAWPKPGLDYSVKMFVKRSSVFGAALVSILLIGCEAGAPREAPREAPRLGSLPVGAPAELEPGYVSLPPLPKWRPPRVVPGCRRIEPRTSASPAIEILSSGGFGGSGTGNVQIWEDGTVLFDGKGCPNDRRRRGRMSPARVRAVIDTLEQAQFLTWSCDEGVNCTDSFITSLTLRRGSTDHTVVDSGCSLKPTLAAQAIELVRQVVGKNPCSPICLVTPAPAFCR